MKNNTKIRLHVSKALFENIAKEVLAEAKKMNMSGGAYTETVKVPKQVKEVNAVADTDKMKKMEEKMSSKEKMAKGLYKEEDMDEMQINVAEEGEMEEAFDPQSVTDLLSVLAGMGGIALGGLGVVKWQDKIKAKNPELYKKLQDVSTAIKKADPSKDLSEKSEESLSLNELRKQIKNK